MGQNQNTSNVEETHIESLYDILGVDKSVTEIELKKSYKKLALQLHPDRNYENPEEATKKFAKVQAAYDVLSDPQERAWYDSHGSSGNAPQGPEYGGKVTKAEELKAYLDPEFQNKFFSTDSGEFYIKVGELFRQLAEEENEAALDQDTQASLLPSFGDDNSSWDQHVKIFYESWSSFSSIKTFSWEDLYRAWDAPDRRSRRAMEMRNKKIRDAAKKEFNKLVRSLVVIVKRRDPRVKKHNKSSGQTKDTTNQSAVNREKSKKEKAERAAKYAAQYEPQEWEQTKEENDEENDEFDSDNENPVDLYECIVCDKLFKTKKQLIAHEKSKKHIKTLRQMQKEMAKEGVDLGLDMNDDAVDDSDEEQDMKTDMKTDNFYEINDNEHQDIDPNTTTNESPPFNDEIKNPRQTNENEASLEELLAQLEGLKTDSTISNTDKPKKSGKAKQRRKKKENPTNDFANKCVTCQHVFPSRNKLFEHVKLSKHAAPLPLHG